MNWRNLSDWFLNYRDGEGIESLWRVSPDVKRAAEALIRDRHHLQRADRANENASNNLERTIEILKKPQEPFQLESAETMAERLLKKRRREK